MTDKASPKGWIIRVTTKRLGKPPSVGIYDAAIPDAADAVEAVRRLCGAGPDTVVEAIAELPSGTYATGKCSCVDLAPIQQMRTVGTVSV